MLGHWTPQRVRMKADALAIMKEGRITLTAETTALFVAALRFLAAEGLADRHCSFTVDVWDASGNTIVEHVGDLSNHAAARAAYAAACEARPGQEVTLRQGIRVVQRREA